jgi:hypothetical protein
MIGEGRRKEAASCELREVAVAEWSTVPYYMGHGYGANGKVLYCGTGDKVQMLRCTTSYTNAFYNNHCSRVSVSQ